MKVSFYFLFFFFPFLVWFDLISRHRVFIDDFLFFFPGWLAGVTGASIRIDDNGDSEGNYTVLAVKFNNISRAINVNKMGDKDKFHCHYEMMPVGRFDYTNNTTPVSNIFSVEMTCNLYFYFVLLNC